MAVQPMSKLLSLRAILLILAVATLNLFFFRSWDGLGTAILIGLFYGLVTLAHWKDILQLPSKTWFLLTSTGIVLSAVVVIIRANDVVQLIAVLTAQLLILALWNSLQARQPGVHSFAELVMTPLTALRNHVVGLIRFFLQSKNAAQPVSSPFASQKVKSLLIGLLISIPVITIVGGLLSSGDPIFQATINNIFDIQLNIDEQLLQRIILTAVCVVIVIPFVQRRLGTIFISPLRVLKNYNLTTEYSVVVFLLTLLLGFFLAVQWKYIFVTVAAETDLSQFGVATYSEYVTRGFAELLFVSVIIYSVVWLGLVLIRSSKVIESAKKLRVLQLLLLSEFAVFLFSLFRRVWLYQSLHGMTVVRVYGSYLLVLVTLFAVTLACRHIIFKSIRWVQVELAILVAAVFLLSVVDVEQQFVVAHPPTVNNKIDYVYLARLSPDGSTGWQQALTYADTVLKDPQLDSDQLITADQRLQIAYAGSIVKMLQVQRYWLIRSYGTASEIKDVYITSLSQTDDRYTDLLPQYLQLDPSQSATAATILKNREVIRTFRDQISNLPADSIPNSLDTGTYFMLYSGSHGCDYSYCYMSFFDWKYYTLQAEKLDVLEQRLRYNQTAYNLYQRREEVLPINMLLELEDRYFQLQQKIQTQPENERDFSVDISLYSPFISPM